MTLGGSVLRAANLLVLCLAALVVAWIETRVLIGFSILAAVASLGFGCALRFRPDWSPWGAPVFAILLGLALGGLAGLRTAFLLQVVVAPVGVCASLLVLYQTRWIPPSRNRDLGIAAAAGGLAFLYLFQVAARAAWTWTPYVHESGLWAIGWTAFALAGSAFNLVLDLDHVERGAAHGAPKALEWYAAFGLLVAIVWFYVEGLLALARASRGSSRVA